MRALGKVCLLLVLALTVAGAEGAEKSRGICPDDKKTCQIGQNEWTCVGLDEKCPKPRKICPDDKKACLVGDDEYVCIDPDDSCP
ncbi:MAG TPA: hypothetical protein VN493_20000 [Thermoanaerobaculia bacterium]|nr:hypothetical protein [Thermoanaerobaculia bacterium]